MSARIRDFMVPNPDKSLSRNNVANCGSLPLYRLGKRRGTEPQPKGAMRRLFHDKP